jgi:hypothetical protein
MTEPYYPQQYPQRPPQAPAPAYPYEQPTAPVGPPVFPGAPPLSSPPQAPRPVNERRVLRAALRWTAAVAVFAVVGTGTAYGLTRMQRTDLPGLATASDGRWDYPQLEKPPLPTGSPAPLDEDNNKAGAHYADLRKLVLPAPDGAKADGALRGTDGWLAAKNFLAEYASKDDRAEFGQKLTDDGLRHIAARGWTTPDGTRTRIYLLQFDTAAVADDLLNRDLAGAEAPTYPLRGATQYATDEGFPAGSEVKDVTLFPYAETAPYGPEQMRLAYLTAGDTLAVIVQSGKGRAAAVPFRQTVTLQSELLT